MVKNRKHCGCGNYTMRPAIRAGYLCEHIQDRNSTTLLIISFLLPGVVMRKIPLVTNGNRVPHKVHSDRRFGSGGL